MKTKGFFATGLIFLGLTAFAQLPQNIKDELKNKYPDASVSRVKHLRDNYVATFISSGEKHKATFDQNGKWIETVTREKLNNIPRTVISAFNKSIYEGWNVEECKQLETPGGKLYSFDVTSPYTFTGTFKTDHYVYFTPSGNMVNGIK